MNGNDDGGDDDDKPALCCSLAQTRATCDHCEWSHRLARRAHAALPTPERDVQSLRVHHSHNKHIRHAALVAEGEGHHKRTMRQTPEERVSTSQRGQSPSPSHPATHPVSARHHAPEQSGFCRRTNSRSQFALRPSSGCRECICTFINQTHQRPTRST